MSRSRTAHQSVRSTGSAGSARWPIRWAAAALCVTGAVAACSAPEPPTPPPSAPTTSAPGGDSRDSGEVSPRPDADLAELLGSGLDERSGGAFGDERMSFFAAGAGPVSDFVQVDYPRGSASQTVEREDGAAGGGAQSYWALGQPLQEAYLRYWVWFAPDFDFVKGGKLPGLYGGEHTSGGDIPDGTNGFSTRYMWRADGKGEVYAYLPSSVDHGSSLGRGTWTFPRGRWACLEQRVHLNEPGRADGVIDVWFEGTQVLHADSLTFRTTPDLQIDGLFFSTFFGGGDSSWASPKDQVARFGGFAISPRQIGCDRS